MGGHAWILSETQLSVTGVRGFVKGLRAVQSPWQSVVPGAPCPSRNQYGTGSHTGVMLLSRFPARALPQQFAEHTYSTARLQVAGMVVGDTWITVGMMYGVTANAQHKQARYTTEVLLAELVERVGYQSTGPRIIGGDFNFAATELDQTQRLLDLGFREVQTLAALWWGRSVVPTSRGRKCIDQLWISPELQALLTDVQVHHDMWSDHAAVVASFRSPGGGVFDYWRVPQQYPWPSDWTCSVDFDVEGDLTAEYAKFWNQVETQAQLWNSHHGLVCKRSQLGRGQTLETVPRKPYQVPRRKARVGEVAPTFLGVSLQHARYFKQLRRLQALSQQLRSGLGTLNSQLNREATWRAIRFAAGFPGGFGIWWGVQGLSPVWPVGLPLVCPSATDLGAMFESMAAWVKQYEIRLAQRRYQFGKQRRVDSLKYVFSDCKLAPAPQVDTLIDRLEVAIEEVRVEESALVLVRAVRLLPDLPVVVQGRVMQVIHHEADQIWVEDVSGVVAGQLLIQEKATTSEAAIIARFHDVWEPRWNKAHHVSPGQWDQICGFAERVMKPLEWQSQPWTLQRFVTAVSRKKKTSGRGPDGVSQPDLAALPATAAAACVSMFEAVEGGKRWPEQLAAGYVNSLAKHLQAQHVDEFRPVTVYSLLYRIWSTERAREALRTVAAVIPDSVQGGVPGRQAKAIWYDVAQTLEFAFLDGCAVHGVLLDISKAFNAIPRYPLWFALRLMDFPVGVMRAWCCFVSAQTRRFKVRQAVGKAVGSNCGLPEGCGLSVFGMIIVDWLLDLWLAQLNKGINLKAFIDDWGLRFHSVLDFPLLWSKVQDFVTAMDLSLDLKKSRLWSTDGAARADLRDFDVTLAHFARNLGAHQNFTRHCWNSVLQERLRTMPQVWTLLRASLSPYHLKLKALPILGWPRALHGIAVVHLGQAHYRVLRSGAMRGLRAERKGANPVLHLASGQFLADPEAWAICQTFRDARELGGYERMEQILGLFTDSADMLPKNGPTAVLLSRIRRLGWVVGGGGLIQDSLGTFSLFDAAWDEIGVRMRLAWSHVLSVEAAHRPTFGGLDSVDVVATQQAVEHFSPADQVYLRCHLDGTLFVQNGRAKFQPGVSDVCPWCGQKDGFLHRAWVCVHFEHCRGHFTPAQRRAALDLPECFSVHGWAVVLEEWRVFVGLLLQDSGFSRMSPVGLPKLATSQWCDLFLDGTCAHPKEPMLRFAAWAVTLASGGPGVLDNQLTLAGHVTGLCQSAFRAELMAVYEALRWASQRCLRVRLWSDCLGVVQGVRRLLSGGVVKPNKAHSDLWRAIASILHEGVIEVQIIKVVSHCSIRSATNCEEEWAYWHNQLTDQAAVAVNTRRPDEFWVAWDALSIALTERRKLHMAVLQMLLKQSRFAHRAQQKETKSVVPVASTPVASTPVVVALPTPPVWKNPEKMWKRYGRVNVDAIHAWWSECGTAAFAGTEAIKLVSGLQLFLDFTWSTGHEGPFVHRKKWYAQKHEIPKACVTNYGERVRVFLSIWGTYLKNHGLKVPNKVARPCGDSIAKFVVCYYLRWPSSKVAMVDSHVFGSMGRQLASHRDFGAVSPCRQ